MKNPKLGQNRSKAGANPPHLDGLCEALWARCRSRLARSERDVAHLVARDAVAGASIITSPDSDLVQLLLPMRV